MGALTEREIFDCLSTNFRLAAEAAERLATIKRTGPTYDSLREKLELIEGACRQAAVWRQDARWLQIGIMMAEAHKRAGDWLRGIKVAGSPVRIKLADGHRHPLFLKLAENLRAGEQRAIELRDKKTGRVGMILPKAGRAPRRDTVPVGWRRTGGILVPAGAA